MQEGGWEEEGEEGCDEEGCDEEGEEEEEEGDLEEGRGRVLESRSSVLGGVRIGGREGGR